MKMELYLANVFTEERLIEKRAWVVLFSGVPEAAGV